MNLFYACTFTLFCSVASSVQRFRESILMLAFSDISRMSMFRAGIMVFRLGGQADPNVCPFYYYDS